MVKKYFKYLFVACISIIFILAIIFYFAGFIVNTTKSIPLGLYQRVNTPVDDARIGDIVQVCLPAKPEIDEGLRRGYIDAGHCPSGYGYVLKILAAKVFDEVSINEQGVFINGVRWPNSTPLKEDGHGLKMPHIVFNNYILKYNEILLMTDHSPTSFDSRYYGIVDKSCILSILRPVYVWE